MILFWVGVQFIAPSYYAKSEAGGHHRLPL
jgi:hypothetical protein